jgi:hypothetical protein
VARVAATAPDARGVRLVGLDGRERALEPAAPREPVGVA